jgi:FkbM family methyltransferase
MLSTYTFFFARRVFRKMNLLFVNLGMRGLGVLNYQDNRVSGEARFLRDYLGERTTPVVFDVGANVGSYSNEVFDANEEARIFAFEPHPATFIKLVANVEKQKNIATYNCAVGNKCGRLNLYDRESNDGSRHASLFREVIEDIHKSRSISHEVEVITLDGFIDEHAIDRIDLLKIDAEGYEFNVLKGATKALDSGVVGAIHFEFNEMNVVSRVFFKDFWDRLPEYQFYRLLPHGLLDLNSYDAFQCEIFAFQNVVAVRRN